MVILKVVRSDLNRMRDFHDDKSNSRWLNNDRENKWNSSLRACFVRSNGITKWKERISIMDNCDACTMLHFGEIILCIVHNWWFPSLFFTDWHTQIPARYFNEKLLMMTIWKTNQTQWHWLFSFSLELYQKVSAQRCCEFR